MDWASANHAALGSKSLSPGPRVGTDGAGSVEGFPPQSAETTRPLPCQQDNSGGDQHQRSGWNKPDGAPGGEQPCGGRMRNTFASHRRTRCRVRNHPSQPPARLSEATVRALALCCFRRRPPFNRPASRSCSSPARTGDGPEGSQKQLFVGRRQGGETASGTADRDQATA